MVNHGNTITVECLLAMLADGRITPGMSLTIWNKEDGVHAGVCAIEIHTFKDGTKTLSFFSGDDVAKGEDIVSAAEVFP